MAFHEKNLLLFDESEGVKLLLKSAMKVERDDIVLEVKDATDLLHERRLIPETIRLICE